MSEQQQSHSLCELKGRSQMRAGEAKAVLCAPGQTGSFALYYETHCLGNTG